MVQLLLRFLVNNVLHPYLTSYSFLGNCMPCICCYLLGILITQFSTEEGHVQIKKKLYLPRVEDKNSNMKMLKVSSFDDLVVSSMNILEPSLIDCNGNPREDGIISYYVYCFLRGFLVMIPDHIILEFFFFFFFPPWVKDVILT